MGLLAEAMSHGVNPNLGRSSGSKLNLDDLRLSMKPQDSMVESLAAPGMISTRSTRRERIVDANAEPFPSSIMREPSQSLRSEEVLMFNRAQSRLNELCHVVIV